MTFVLIGKGPSFGGLKHQNSGPNRFQVNIDEHERHVIFLM